MPNEFEKVVREKMDELKLVPSEPVWQKVEMQIRNKKDRRRLIFWIPFLALLLGGGLWMGIGLYSGNIAYHQSNNEKQKRNQITSSENKQETSHTTTVTGEGASKDSLQHKKEVAGKLNVHKPANKDVAALTIKFHGRTNKDLRTKIGLIHQAVIQKTPPKKISLQKTNSVVGNERVPAKWDDAGLTRARNSEIIIAPSTKRINAALSAFEIIQTIDTTVSVSIDSTQAKPTITNDNAVHHDTASIKKLEIKKYAAPKWKFNLMAASGLSGLSSLNFLDVFGGEKSLNTSYASAPGASQTPGATYFGPSSARKRLSFSIGAVLQKDVSRRLQLSFGLQYNYYSNSILVGSRIRRDTVFRFAYAVSQYFANNSNAVSYSAASQLYNNHYHFISLPLSLSWQVSKKLPLNFYTGFSVQKMIQTDALVFDYSAQAYYHNNKAFNKILLFTEYGLSYSIPFGKRYLAVGPELNYGLSSLEKNNPDHHLFSYGLKAQLQLNKK